MSNSKVSTIDSKYQREHNVNHNTNGAESIHNTEMQEVHKTGYGVEINGEGSERVKISTNVAKSTMDSQETIIDIEIMKPNVSSGNILFTPRRLLKKLLVPEPYRKHTTNPYQGYPPPGAPPGGPPGYPSGYPPPPPGYPSGYSPPPPGYPPGYPPGAPTGYPQQGYPPPGAQQGGNDDENRTVIYDPETRNIFIRKVLTIVLIMLIITAIFVAVVLYVPILRTTFRKLAIVLIIAASVLVLGADYALMCSPCSRTGPGGWFILIITCLGMSVLSAAISSRYRTEIVLFAVMATAGVVIVCLALACTKFDFTKYLLFFIVISSAVFITGLIVGIFMLATGTYMKTVHLIILIVSVIVLAVGLVIELQMVIGGKTVELGEDEYTLAAFMLYTSIIHIFLQLVQILGILDN